MACRQAHLMRRSPVRSTLWCRRVTRLRVASARNTASWRAATCGAQGTEQG